MKKILFVIAMEKEAIDIAEKLELEEIAEYQKNNKHKARLYRNNNISLLITGIGKQQTAINLTQYLENNEKPNIIINIGYVGSTNSKIGSWINVSKSYNYDWGITGEQKYTIEGFEDDKLKILKDKELQKLECYSAESFVTSTEIEGNVIFDMELHSIYLLCCIYGIDLISLKKVSDNLNLDDYYKNIDMKEVMELTSGLEYLKEII